MAQTKKVTEYIIEFLTEEEASELRRLITGYGQFKKTAIAMDIPMPTLRDMVNKKYGKPVTVKKIRKKLQELEVVEKGGSILNGIAKV